MKKGHKVTIVVPVYGDWVSLNQCIKSLKLHLDSKLHSVIFVNDHGPEYLDIEKKILDSIKDFDNFRYYANQENVGFLQNCNNAVLNLDKSGNDILLLNSDTVVTKGFLEEIVGVAYSSSSIGTVCPRSSDATIASIPLNAREEDSIIEPDESYAMYDSIKKMLPRYSISPVSVGFCFFVKRSVIEKMDGLFDEIFGKGYGEEDDFCMRINARGFVSVIANHAFVTHLSARSFTPELRAQIISVNAKILNKRHPYFDKLVNNYLEYKTFFVETFSQTIYFEKNNKSRKVLIDLHSLPPFEVENMHEIRNVLESITSDENISFTVAVSGKTRDYLSVNNLGRFTYKQPSEINEQFDLGVSLFTVRDVNNLAFLQRTCARIATPGTVVDFLQSNHNATRNVQSTIASLMLNWSDVVIVDRKSADCIDNLVNIYGVDKSKIVIVSLQSFLDNGSLDLYFKDLLIDTKFASKRWNEINTIKAVARPEIEVLSEVVRPNVLRRIKNFLSEN